MAVGGWQSSRWSGGVLLSVATINWSTTYQTVDGFGASSAWMSAPLTQTALDELYSTTTGAGLSLLRTDLQPYGATTETLIGQQAAAYGVRSWSTPWSPPREWKTNDDNNNGGALEPAHYQDYANYLADYVQNSQAQGVPLYAISLQNEPDEDVSYNSCLWTEQQFAAFLPYVGQTFAARGITTKVVLPEESGWDFTLANSVMADPALSQYVGILAAHNYNSLLPYATVNDAMGKPVWMTEWYSGATGVGITDAVTLAVDIHNAFVKGGVQAYNYWWINSSSSVQLMQNWVPTARLWAMGQYSRFVRPGWVLVGETDDGGLVITAFKDPASGKFAVIAVNSGSAAVTETFTLNGVSAGSVTPYITSASDDLAQYAAVALTGGTSFSYTIAAGSIVTFTGINSSAPTLQAPDNLRAAPQYGALEQRNHAFVVRQLLQRNRLHGAAFNRRHELDDGNVGPGRAYDQLRRQRSEREHKLLLPRVRE